MRTRVHEYGGGAWLLHGDTAFFSDVRRPAPLPPGPGRRAARRSRPSRRARRRLRYADGRVSPGRRADRLRARDPRRGGEPANDLVAAARRRLAASRGCSPPGATSTPSRGSALTARRCSPGPAGTTPTCPGTAPSCGWRRSTPRRQARLWPAARASRSGSPSGAPTARSTTCPTASGWWNLFREDEQLTDEQAELGYPQWGFGGSTYAFLEGGDIACVRVERGVERLCLLRAGSGRLEELGLPYTAVATRTCAATASA